MSLNLVNSALLTSDVLTDAHRLFDLPNVATPAELHALDSLIEAAALHDKLYVYEWPNPDPDLGPLQELFKWDLIERGSVADACEALLSSMGLSDLMNDVLYDRTYGGVSLTYKRERLIDFLGMLVEYESELGFDQMSRLIDDDDAEEQAFTAAERHRFSPRDVLGLDSWFRKTRAFATTASELGLHVYTGLISRPFLLDCVNVRRRGALSLFEKLKEEFDDFDDSDIPEWRRIAIPATTQHVLTECKGNPTAIPNEIMRVRHSLADFRAALTAQAIEMRRSADRFEKRRIRKDSEAALAALLQKLDTTTRLTHRMWDILKNPLVAHVKAGDQLVQRDQLNQAIDKTLGLSDVWALLGSAPAVEKNAKLLQDTFHVTPELKDWHAARTAAERLEGLMRRHADPPLASVAPLRAAPRTGAL